MDKTGDGIVKNLSAFEFQTQLNNDPLAILLDVRTEHEFNSGRIPDAINIDVMSHSFYDDIAALDKTKTYFVYCRSGGRSMQACLSMAELGFTVCNLTGGINSWSGKIVGS